MQASTYNETIWTFRHIWSFYYLMAVTQYKHVAMHGSICTCNQQCDFWWFLAYISCQSIYSIYSVNQRQRIPCILGWATMCLLRLYLRENFHLTMASHSKFIDIYIIIVSVNTSSRARELFYGLGCLHKACHLHDTCLIWDKPSSQFVLV